jgi:hypothetical protein
MLRRSEPQLCLAFARPQPSRGGLEVDQYCELIGRLRQDASRIATRFDLPQFNLDADRAEAADRYGLCWEDGRIRVRLVNVRTGRPLKYSALIDTVVHELAHLRYLDHGPKWELLYHRMLEWCRREGLYAPRKPRARPALPPLSIEAGRRQMDLFPGRS